MKTRLSALLMCLTGAVAAGVAEWQDPVAEPRRLGTSALLQHIAEWDGQITSRFENACHDELRRRINGRLLSREESVLLLKSCFAGDADAAPHSVLWNTKYEWLLEQYYASYAEIDECELEALSIPAGVLVWENSLVFGECEWPAQKECYLELRLSTAWRPALGNRVRAIADMATALQVQGTAMGGLYLPIPPLPEGLHEVPLRIEIGVLDADGLFRPNQIIRDVASLSVATPSDKVAEVRSRSLRRVLPRLIQPRLRSAMMDAVDAAFTESVRSFEIDVDYEVFERECTDWEVLGLSCELVDDLGEVHARAFVGISDSSVMVFDNEVIHLGAAEGEYEVRVRPDPGVWHAMAATKGPVEGDLRMWSGEVLVPVIDSGGE